MIAYIWFCCLCSDRGSTAGAVEQAKVYAYPWNVDRQPDRKVSVHISRFIAQGDRVYLDANWAVENMHTHQSKARLFSTTVQTGKQSDEIVSAMDKAFGQLEAVIATGVR